MTAARTERRLGVLLELRGLLQENATRIVPITLEPSFARDVLDALEGLDLEDIAAPGIRVKRDELQDAIESAITGCASDIVADVFAELNAIQRRTA